MGEGSIVVESAVFLLGWFDVAVHHALSVDELQSGSQLVRPVHHIVCSVLVIPPLVMEDCVGGREGRGGEGEHSIERYQVVHESLKLNPL